jgi:hypothetical protein
MFPLFCRIHFVPPGSGEKFYLRTLLNYVTGCTSYDDIKTVDNHTLNSFKETCFALGLLDDDKEFVDCINQAAQWGTATFLRILFVALLVSAQFSRPEYVWEKTWRNLADDVLSRQRRILRVQGILLHFQQFNVIIYFRYREIITMQ